jgi:GWxTD domain-containing protein
MRVRASSVLWILAFVPALVLAAGPTDWKTPNKDWAKGPVHWIMTPDEEKAFRALKTDEERAAFAKSFWEKRDPTPGTPENEFEIIFWQKVEAADKNYHDQIREGSMTDIGRVFILFGPPAAQHKDSRYTYWDYEPTPLNGLKEKMTVSFATVDTGMLLREKKVVEDYLAAHQEARGIGWQIPQIAVAPTANETAQAAPAKEHVEDTSPESQRQIPILDAVAAKGSGPTDVSFQVHNDTYAAVDGTTLVVTTIEVPREAAHGSGSEAILSFARLAPDAAGSKPINLTGALPFVPAPAADGPSGSFVYQARTNLKPGAYHMTVVVEDKVVKGQMGTLVQPLEIPDYATKNFDMSSVSILALYKRNDEGVGPDEEKHAGLFSMGSFRLVPRATPVLQKSDALAFYYQIYNPSPDPATSKPNLESTYTFYIKDPTGWKPFRKPVVKPVGQVELWDLALKDLLRPDQVLPVDFRMEAKVTDKTSGKSVSREILFSVR